MTDSHRASNATRRVKLVLAGLALGLVGCDPVFVVWAVNDSPSQRTVELTYSPEVDPWVVRVPPDSVGVVFQAPGRLNDATVAVYDTECRLVHEVSIDGSAVRIRLHGDEVEVADGHGVPDASMDSYFQGPRCS